MLPRLLPLDAATLADETAAGRWKVVRQLMRALRRARRDGLAGHWTYDPNRHLALRRALDAELKGLSRLQPGAALPTAHRRAPAARRVAARPRPATPRAAAPWPAGTPHPRRAS